jgi:hypothetical protein
VLPDDYFKPGQVEQFRAFAESDGFVGTIWGSPAEWNFGGFLTNALVADQVDPGILA